MRTGKGLRAAPGGEGVAAAYGRKFAPLLSTIGFTGKPGEVAKVPTGGTIKSPLLILVGPRASSTTVDPDARTPRRRCRGPRGRNAASVALALPADDEHRSAAVVEGSMLGGYPFTAYKTAAARATARPRSWCSPTPPAPRPPQAAVETAQVVAAATALARDWVNTPPGDLTPSGFADAVVAEHKARKAAKVKVDGHRREAAARPAASAASSASARARPTRRGWCSSPTPRGVPRPTSPWSARASRSTPAGSPIKPGAAWRR